MILFLCFMFSDISYATVVKPKRIYLRKFKNQTVRYIKLSRLDEYLEKGVKSLNLLSVPLVRAEYILTPEIKIYGDVYTPFQVVFNIEKMPKSLNQSGSYFVKSKADSKSMEKAIDEALAMLNEKLITLELGHVFVSGKVVNKEGKPIEKATVIVIDQNYNSVAELETDKEGLFTIENLKPDNYNLTISKRKMLVKFKLKSWPKNNQNIKDIVITLSREKQQVNTLTFGPGPQHANRGIDFPKPKFPPDLAINIQFNEPSGNNALDADEKATIILNITNNGMGEAYGVEPQINLNSSISDLTIGDFEAIDKILPNTIVEAKTSVFAGRKILSKNIELEVNVSEYNGFDLYPSGLLKIQTIALLPPKLVLADVGIDDLTNSNGRIDPNEIIEATAIIHNIGQGIAKSVNVDVNYGDNIFNAGDSKTSFSLGKMEPNEKRQVTFQFFATRKAQEDLPINLNITEQYQKYGSNQNAGLSLKKEFKKSIEVIIAAKENKLVEITSVDGISVDIEKNIPKTGMKNRDAIAVVIGNKEYTGDIPNVDFAIRDAEFVKEYLIKTMGYREGNIFYYSNATKGQMEVAFEELKNAVKPNKSDVFVYYSGHGAPDPESKQGYFVPVDANPNYINKTGYSVDELYTLLSKIKAKNTLVVIDACFSGSSDQGMILKDISPVGVRVKDYFLNSKNSAVFTSATGEQVSSWYRDKSHSLFTYYFLKGLQGEADLNRDGNLVLSEMKNYIDENVPYMARKINNRKQEPQLMTDDESRVLVKY